MKSTTIHGGALGTKTYVDGVYTGNLINNKREGNGRMEYGVSGQGGVYEGFWINNKREGKGKMMYSHGDEYIGYWYRDRENGKGKMTFKNGDVYDGDWEDSEMHGNGKMIFANGDVFDGEWVQDMREGNGTITYANGEVYTGLWANDVPGDTTWEEESWEAVRDHYATLPHYPNAPSGINWGAPGTPTPTPPSSYVTPKGSPFLFSKKSVLTLPSKVIDIENDEYSLSLSQMDFTKQKDPPIVFLAGKNLFVYTKKRLQTALADKTSVVYECGENGSGVKLEVPYFNLRKLFHTIPDGLVPVKQLENTMLFSGKQTRKAALSQRYESVTNQIDSIAKSNLDFSDKKKNIKSLLLENKLPPIIYQFVVKKIGTFTKKVGLLISEAVVQGVPNSAISGLHCQEQGGIKWTVYKMVQVANHRRKTVKKNKSANPTKSKKITKRSAYSAP